jgi:hypothetical protein
MESQTNKKLETSAECYEIWVSRNGIGSRVCATVMRLNFPGHITPNGEVTKYHIAILDGHFDRLPTPSVLREWKDLPDFEQYRYRRLAAASPITGAEMFKGDEDERHHLARKSFPRRFFESLATFPLGVSLNSDEEALNKLKHNLEHYKGTMPKLMPYLDTPKKG